MVFAWWSLPLLADAKECRQRSPLAKRRGDGGLNEEAFKSEYNHLLETLASGGGGVPTRNIAPHRGGHHNNHSASNGIGTKGIFRDLNIGNNHPLETRGNLLRRCCCCCCCCCREKTVSKMLTMTLETYCKPRLLLLPLLLLSLTHPSSYFVLQCCWRFCRCCCCLLWLIHPFFHCSDIITKKSPSSSIPSFKDFSHPNSPGGISGMVMTSRAGFPMSGSGNQFLQPDDELPEVRIFGLLLLLLLDL